MDQYDFDLITIGGGSGGVAASRRAAAAGARVALCEMDRIGGTCVLRGCIPKKLLVYSASFAEGFADCAGYGWEVGTTLTYDWTRLQNNKERELDRLNGVYRRLLQEAGVTTLTGHAELCDAHTVRIGERTISGRYILIATGSSPLRPKFSGSELGVTSNEMLSLPTLPRRLLIVGGGYIAVEMACIFHALGCAVSMLIRGDLLLRGFDQDLRAHLTKTLHEKGIRILPNHETKAIAPAADGALRLQTQAGEEFVADKILLATGRAPSTFELGLDAVGIGRGEKGEIVVNEYSATSVPSVYAIGDCTNRLNLTPIAVAEGRAVAETLFRNNPMHVNYQGVPTAVFSLPPLGSVGLSEVDAQKQYGALDVYVTNFQPMKNGLAGRKERTFMKLVVDKSSQRVLGCHMVGSDAPEIIQSLAVALTAGAKKSDFDRTIALHPTSAEEFMLMRERRP